MCIITPIALWPNYFVCEPKPNIWSIPNLGYTLSLYAQPKLVWTLNASTFPETLFGIQKMGHATAPSVHKVPPEYFFAKRPYTASLSIFTGNGLVFT